MEYFLLLSSIENILGKSHKKARDNYAFSCPFCNHRKPKLEINLATNEKGENPWECWVCNSRGRTIKSLLYQLKIPTSEGRNVLQYVNSKDTAYESNVEVLSLPSEFIPLSSTSSSNIIANKVKNYLYKRGLNEIDFLRYNIGYCTKGEYSGRIIFPSYDCSNKLNYFVSRSFEDHFQKYKNPQFSRDVIFFENLINWNVPVVLVEGVFDAISVRRNAVPILGKTVSKSLMKKLASNKVQDIYIALDNDAMKEALSLSMKLLELGKKVYLVEMQGKDPSDMGFSSFTHQLSNISPITFGDLLKFKLIS